MHRLVCTAIVLACVGCQSGRPAWPGRLLGATVANAQDEQAYAQVSPDQRFELEDTPGATSSSWQNAQRDYPGALPGR